MAKLWPTAFIEKVIVNGFNDKPTNRNRGCKRGFIQCTKCAGNGFIESYGTLFARRHRPIIHRIHCTLSVGMVPVNEQRRKYHLNAACETRDRIKIQSSLDELCVWLVLALYIQNQRFAQWQNIFLLFCDRVIALSSIVFIRFTNFDIHINSKYN